MVNTHHNLGYILRDEISYTSHSMSLHSIQTTQQTLFIFVWPARALGEGYRWSTARCLLPAHTKHHQHSSTARLSCLVGRYYVYSM